MSKLENLGFVAYLALTLTLLMAFGALLEWHKTIEQDEYRGASRARYAEEKHAIVQEWREKCIINKQNMCIVEEGSTLLPAPRPTFKF